MQHDKTFYYAVIAKNIKSLRQKLGLSQEKFAEKIGCSREFISRIENNNEKISLNMLLDVCCIFGITPEEFFTE